MVVEKFCFSVAFNCSRYYRKVVLIEILGLKDLFGEDCFGSLDEGKNSYGYVDWTCQY